jgi:TusA-related sulfurtransferase
MSEEIVDARNVKCPMPIVMIAKTVKKIESGSTIKVMANDPVFCMDVEAWCKQTQNELLGIEKKEDYFIAIIKKK